MCAQSIRNCDMRSTGNNRPRFEEGVFVMFPCIIWRCLQSLQQFNLPDSVPSNCTSRHWTHFVSACVLMLTLAKTLLTSSCLKIATDSFIHISIVVLFCLLSITGNWKKFSCMLCRHFPEQVVTLIPGGARPACMQRSHTQCTVKSRDVLLGEQDFFCLLFYSDFLVLVAYYSPIDCPIILNFKMIENKHGLNQHNRCFDVEVADVGWTKAEHQLGSVCLCLFHQSRLSTDESMSSTAALWCSSCTMM